MDVAGGEILHVERLGVLEPVELVLVIPHRDLVAPPELAADAPVLEVLHPVGVGLGPALGAELDLAGCHRVGGFLDAGILEEPLHRNARLDRHVRALGEADVVLIFLHLDEQTHLFQLRGGLFARHEAVEAVQLGNVRAVDVRVRREDVDDLEVVAETDFKVGLVVGRRDLQRAGAELDVHVIVGDHRDRGVRERPEHRASHVFRKARVLRVHGHGHVAHQRFRTGGGDFKELAGRVRELVLHEVELRALRRHNHLLIGQRGERDRAPVHDALTAVDQAFLEQLHENVADPLGIGLVHGEALARPIAGAAEALELIDDDVAVLVLEGPDALEELVAAEVAAGELFVLTQFALDLRLGRDAGVVGAGQPQHFFPLLAGAAGQDVLDRVVEDVSEVQDAGDVRRRDDDRVGGLVRGRIGLETFPVDPSGVPLGFHLLGFVGFRQVGHERGAMPEPPGFVKGGGKMSRRHAPHLYRRDAKVAEERGGRNSRGIVAPRPSATLRRTTTG